MNCLNTTTTYELVFKGASALVKERLLSVSPVRYHFFSCESVGHGDASPFDVRSPLIGRRVGRAMLVGEGECRLQVAQRESPADRTVDVGAAGLGDCFALTHVKTNELLD